MEPTQKPTLWDTPRESSQYSQKIQKKLKAGTVFKTKRGCQYTILGYDAWNQAHCKENENEDVITFNIDHLVYWLKADSKKHKATSTDELLDELIQKADELNKTVSDHVAAYHKLKKEIKELTAAIAITD